MLGRRDKDSAARAAVQFCHDETRNICNFLKNFDLRQRILAGGGVEYEHNVMRCRRIKPTQNPPDFGELVHQLTLVLQTTGGIDDQHVDALCCCPFDRVKYHTRRIAAFGSGNNGDTDPFRPDLQLPDGGRAKGVTRRQHDAVILLEEQMRHFGDGCGLARSIHADDEDNLRSGKGVDIERGSDGCEHGGNLVFDNLAHAFFVDAFVEASGGNLLADMACHCRAEVGGNQRVLKVVERFAVELGFGDEARDILGKLARGFLETAEYLVGPSRFFAHAMTSARNAPSLYPLTLAATMLPSAICRSSFT